MIDPSRTDSEICGLALEALVNVMTTDSTDEQSIQNEDLAVQFSEIFLKDEENVTNLLSLLEASIFSLRGNNRKVLKIVQPKMCNIKAF